MNKYINADTVLHYYGVISTQPDFNPQSAELQAWKLWKNWFDEEVWRLISQIATRDGIDIVHCRDCKFNEAKNCGYAVCHRDLFNQPIMKLDDFCSRAERRDDCEF